MPINNSKPPRIFGVTAISNRLITLLIIFGICLISGIALLLFFSSRPNQGKIISSDDQSRVQQLKTNRLRTEIPSNLQKEAGRVSTSCFSYQYETQYSPKVEEDEESCVVRSSVFDPKGQITVSWRRLRADQHFAEDTGIMHRLQEKERYQAYELKHEQYQPTFAFIGEKELSIFIEINGGVFVISVHDFFGSTEEAAAIIDAVLSSIAFS